MLHFGAEVTLCSCASDEGLNVQMEWMKNKVTRAIVIWISKTEHCNTNDQMTISRIWGLFGVKSQAYVWLYLDVFIPIWK